MESGQTSDVGSIIGKIQKKRCESDLELNSTYVLGSYL